MTCSDLQASESIKDDLQQTWSSAHTFYQLENMVSSTCRIPNICVFTYGDDCMCSIYNKIITEQI